MSQQGLLIDFGIVIAQRLEEVWLAWDDSEAQRLVLVLEGLEEHEGYLWECECFVVMWVDVAKSAGCAKSICDEMGFEMSWTYVCWVPESQKGIAIE